MIIHETLPLAVVQPAAAPGGQPRLHVSARSRVVRVRRELPSATGRRAWLLELDVEVPAVDPERVLAECEQFLVDTEDGRHLGVVERIERSETTGVASALLVAAGWFGRRTLRIEANAVEALLPEERRVIVDPTWARSIGREGRRI